MLPLTRLMLCLMADACVSQTCVEVVLRWNGVFIGLQGGGLFNRFRFLLEAKPYLPMQELVFSWDNDSWRSSFCKIHLDLLVLVKYPDETCIIEVMQKIKWCCEVNTEWSEEAKTYYSKSIGQKLLINSQSSTDSTINWLIIKELMISY